MIALWQWKLSVAVHTSAPMALSRALVHDMMRQKWGRIVNVTTSLGTMNRKFLPVFAGFFGHAQKQKLKAPEPDFAL